MTAFVLLHQPSVRKCAESIAMQMLEEYSAPSFGERSQEQKTPWQKNGNWTSKNGIFDTSLQPLEEDVFQKKILERTRSDNGYG